jgi:GrpB-like predicted nucleotidyltransferase (UPF0157 family)
MITTSPAADPIEICDWSPFWVADFRAKSANLHGALGSLALRIDHIGSTSIEGMAAKPIIDIQVSVGAFEPFGRIESVMNRAGYVWKASNPELTKRYFRERPGAERTHIHVRLLGSWNEQWALLFRDYMRAHAGERAAYIALKRDLSARFRNERSAYTGGKPDHLWSVIRRADSWAKATGWRLGESDAWTSRAFPLSQMGQCPVGSPYVRGRFQTHSRPNVQLSRWRAIR